MKSLNRIDPKRFETPAILKQLSRSSRVLAELKGKSASLPEQELLINTLSLQEAKDSSAIENIVTTHDELFQQEANSLGDLPPAAKEVLRYRQALTVGHQALKRNGLLSVNLLVDIQAELEQNRAGLRKLPGTTLRDDTGRIVYEPPTPEKIPDLLGDLERFIHQEPAYDADPLIRMALIHHRFETIHPFYDGNGRTGRILNVLYLVQNQLLDIPILYLSRSILERKSEYYRLLQTVRTEDTWEEWVLYLLEAVEDTSRRTLDTIGGILRLLEETKNRLRALYKFYSRDLLYNLFTHPYTKIEFVEKDLGVTRLTATRYLEALVKDGFLIKRKIGRSNYFINPPLTQLLISTERPLAGGEDPTDPSGRGIGGGYSPGQESRSFM